MVKIDMYCKFSCLICRVHTEDAPQRYLSWAIKEKFTTSLNQLPIDLFLACCLFFCPFGHLKLCVKN